MVFRKNGRVQKRGKVNLIGRLQLQTERVREEENEAIMKLRVLRIQVSCQAQKMPFFVASDEEYVFNKSFSIVCFVNRTRWMSELFVDLFVNTRFVFIEQFTEIQKKMNALINSKIMSNLTCNMTLKLWKGIGTPIDGVRSLIQLTIV